LLLCCSAALREIFLYECDANRFPGEDSRKAAKAQRLGRCLNTVGLIRLGQPTFKI